MSVVGFVISNRGPGLALQLRLGRWSDHLHSDSASQKAEPGEDLIEELRRAQIRSHL